ncbi:hypothetical protein ACFO26_01575 [Lactococcus nasutitermitis]|uniref:Uncharacterized protein n=1 Tax=Lactococcus nasutitermitis TaxID=1652957 RepID=A0ABV9JAA8_9LACT|nr:hypothetical protein [Lactococcus nasutitermitis]
MYKKDFTEWQLSKDFDMEKLRNLFNQSLPFAHHGYESRVHASNRLFWLVIESAERNGLVGRKGLNSIRREMSMEELLFDILMVATPIPLISTDTDYYFSEPPQYSASMKPALILGIPGRIGDRTELVWVRDNIDNPTKMICRLLLGDLQQDMFEIPIVKNDEGVFELSFKDRE